MQAADAAVPEPEANDGVRCKPNLATFLNNFQRSRAVRPKALFSFELKWNGM